MVRITNSFKRLLTGRPGKWLLASAAVGALTLSAVAQGGRYDPPGRVERREPDRRLPDRHDNDQHEKF